MDKETLKDILRAKGIPVYNCNIKNSFKRDGERRVGLFGDELDWDFYFYDNHTSAIYKLPKVKNFRKELQEEPEFGRNRYSAPFSMLELIAGSDELNSETTTTTTTSRLMLQQDVPEIEVEEELEDAAMSTMTLRDYACIKLGVPKSTKQWLNDIIKQSKCG